MPIVASVSRLLIAFFAIAVSTVNFAQAARSFAHADTANYLERCETLQVRMTRLEGSKNPKDPEQVVKALLDQSANMSHLQSSSSRLDLTAAESTRCNALFAKVDSLVSQAQAKLKVAQDIKDKESAAASLALWHKSPEYKLARSLGYEDAGDIGQLDMHENLDGEEKMRSMLFLVDRDCGSFFQAVQNTPPYVIYTIEKTVITCGKAKRIAVIGTSNVGNEDLIDEKATFEYVGWEKIMSPNGFPISVRVVKQRPK